ncbi:glycolate oxidase iron-sulfur subunit [Bacillus thermophilus]|uniref:Glycolate oxidase iron-sulfur subunit n=1 Tax=Siminovitchia thermophila TaxID=1245522 RepID=A0ABS2RC90_9BACI|nr:glycolate oxidase iron-sulfur subunit [Siminovitchia thermophila]ONK25297.1 glycolate oxidase [Bacillus sp. VT-16-64]
MSAEKQREAQQTPACEEIRLGNYLWQDPPDPNKWADCVHCGMCLESCPTYEITGQEQHSPRGRVHLIQSVAEGRLEVNEDLVHPVFDCLDCRACTTACPADVNVGGLIEEARGQIRQAMPLTGWKNIVSKLFLESLFPYPARMQKIGGMLKLYQKSGIQTVVRKTGLIRVMPKHLVEMEGIMPVIEQQAVQKKYKNEDVIKTKTEKKGEAALLTGCIMDIMFSDVNEATIHVLNRNGVDVTIPKNQTCCGALHVHAGDREMGRKLAKQNIQAFAETETIVVNAAGCGSMMKEYPELFRFDQEWKERAEVFSNKIKDISEYLHDIGYEKPTAEIHKRVTYHDACHLVHGQGISKEPRDILQAIPGVEIVEMPNADRCCGSAGIYNITNPEMADAILASKMSNVPHDVDIISMGNPGCMLQMALGVQRHGRRQEIVHTVQLLDLAYQKEKEGVK